MNSATLTEKGFTEWFPLKALAISNMPYEKSSVFVIIDRSISGEPTSDILYIGRSKKPTKRILGGYLAGYGGKNTKRISQKLLTEGYIERTDISWILTDKPKATQKELLAKFEKEHGAYPTWNVKKEILKKRKAKTAIKAKTLPKTKAAIKTKTKLPNISLEKPKPGKENIQTRETPT